MTLEDFLNELMKRKKAFIRRYLSGPEVNPENYPWELYDLYTMEHEGQLRMFTLADNSWPEIGTKHDIDSFDGTTMICVVEQYILEVRLTETEED